MGTHETHIYKWRLIRLLETNGDSLDSWKLLGTHESPENHIDSWGLTRLKETTGDSLDSSRLNETHETQGDYLGLTRRLILIKTQGES